MTDPDLGSAPSMIGASASRPFDESASCVSDGRRQVLDAAEAEPDGQGIESRIHRRDDAGRFDMSASERDADGFDVPEGPRTNKRRRRARKARRLKEASASPDGSTGQCRGSSSEARGGRPPEPKNEGVGKPGSGKCRPLQGRPLASGSATAASVCGKPDDRNRNDSPGPSGGMCQSTGVRRDGGSPQDLTGNVSGCNDRSTAAPGAPARRQRRCESHAPALYAALDLGTNNCRLLIAKPTRPGQFRVVDAFSRIVRLGEGLGASGRLSQSAMDRAVEALKVCAAKLESRSIRNSRLIATEACRSAVNGPAFIERVKTEAGLDLEIVDRETEARLAVSGCSSLVERETRSMVLFDIGGGSSEIAVIRLPDNRTNRLANHITAWTSLPVGVVTLSERHGGREVTRAVFEAMVDDVDAMLSRFDCPAAMTGHHDEDDHGFHLIGTSGTVTTLAGVHLDLPRYDRRRVDGLWLSSSEIDCMLAKLLSWDFDQRSANPCIGAERADLVMAGCAILEAIRKRWPSQRMRVADRGLREGMLTDMMASDGVWRRARGHRYPPRRGAPSSSISS